MSYREHAIGHAARDAANEALLAEEKHGRGFNSPAEFYGVLAEEQYEFLIAMHANDLPQMLKECRQIAAVAIRFMEHYFEKGEP